ncbi:MAG: substrate-binding domain-containing protein [Microbacterium sp.]
MKSPLRRARAAGSPAATSASSGFDDSTWALRCDPPLSTVHQPATELGRAAAESVLRQLRGEDPESGGRVLECPVVWREAA